MRMVRRNPVDLDAATVSTCVRSVFDAWPVKRAWLFGSVARGTQNRRSDVDIAVELTDGIDLGFTFLSMEDEVADALGCNVDLVTIERSRSTAAFLQSFDNDKVMVYERAAG